jgi:GR25 family glycosyltransferase involved in LPS biosynthesis
MNKIKKVVSIIAVVIITIAGVYGYKLYRDIFSANTKFTQDQVYVEIPTDSEFENVKKIISPYIEDMDKFETTANKKSYPRNVKSGRFLLKKGMGSNAIINSLRQNVPVNLAFNNQERLEDFAGRIASQLECDSLSILNAFKDKQFLEENGYRLIRPFKKYDVLFYGVICDRRRKIIDELSTSFNIHIESDCFGEELVSKVLNSRVVVNIHYYEDAILETTRIHEVLSLGIPVVSEDSTDIHRYEDLAKVVKFVKSGCVDSLKQEISFLLRNEYEYNSTVESIKNYVNNSYEKANYYFLRYMLAWNWITFEDFYRYGEKYIGLNFNTDKLCLTIDENNRCCKETKNTLLEEGFNFFTGVRHNVPWIGCGLSYKYIARKSLDKDIIPLTICEDDTIFNEKFKPKYRTILRYLKQNKNKWHLFSGLSAHFNKDAKILKIEEFEGIEFIYLNKVVSTVFNIYSKDILQIISVWDHKDAELTLLPIDRYIESMNDLVVITTIPYLAGHNSEQTSTLWNFNNIEYSQMIAESQNLLQIKVNEYKQKELRYN